MSELRQKEPRIRDAAHLAFVRASGCVVCPKGVNRPAEAAHIRMACDAIGKSAIGMQEKPDDKWSCGLCAYHHRTGILAQHKMAEADFWKMHGRNPFEIAARLWIASGGAARAAERAANPKPVKPRKINPRDRAKPKRQIPARPAILSRGFDKAPPQRSASRPLERRT